MSARYALYFAPAPDSVWGRFGARWFGRDDPALAEPRRYGFHATLKAPFRLRAGAHLQSLIDTLDAFAAARRAFSIGRLRVARLDRFYALVPVAPEPRLNRPAAECVRRFDAWRAPLSGAELDRRRRAPLSRREEALLVRWGYPYVLDRFHFHMSLTGALAAGAPFTPPRPPAEALRVDAVSVFEEPAAGAPFRLLHRSPFALRGRLVYVVGASGSSKDALIAWVRERLAGNVRVARRTITRPVQAAGEQHRAVDESEFDVLLERGAFALNWRANGHRYGIGREIDDWLDEGRTVVVNGSREHLPLARATYPQLEAVHVSAPVALLRERLSGRAREPMEQVHARLRRTLPVTGAALEIDNTGALENAGDQLLRFLVPDN